jgi:hypothetical protein
LISSPKTQFVRTAAGQKTPKMLEVEQMLGRTLEEDFREYHLEKGWGQKRLADRWGVRKNLIFCSNPRARNRCWAEILSLPVRRIEAESVLLNQKPVPKQKAVSAVSKPKCEACNEQGTHFDRAHWISAASGGSTQRFNILRLCPNCHRKLDRDDATTIERCKASLLYREAKRILNDGTDSHSNQTELVRVCEAIITRKVT